MEKLAALVPLPRAHITRYHGAFAPHSKARKKIVLRETTHVGEPPTSSSSQAKMSWAKLLNRVFKIDVTRCQFCRGEIKIVAAILEKKAVEKILNHLGLPTEPPIIHLARPPPQTEFDAMNQS